MMKKQIYCIKRKVSDLDCLVFKVTIREIENNLTKICSVLSEKLHLGKHKYKFKNNYDGKYQVHTIRMYFKFENKLSYEDEKIIENLQIDEHGNLRGKIL